MVVRFYADETRVAIYEEASGGGDPVSPNSQMNRPVLNPTAWLSNIYFHSDLNYYEIAVNNLSVTVNHAAVPTLTRSIAGRAGDYNGPVTFIGRSTTANHLLVTHGLGYAPRFFCIYDGKLIPHGIPTQTISSGGARFVSAYSTTTQIRLHESAVSTHVDLPAANRNYQVIVFRNPEENLLANRLDITPGSVNFGRGKFRSNEPHLRADGSGDVQWPIARRRTAAIRNGGLRAYYPDGTFVDFGSFNGSLSAPTFWNTSAGV